MLKSIFLIAFMTVLYSGCQDKSNQKNKSTEEQDVKAKEEMTPEDVAAQASSKDKAPYFKGVGTEPFWDVQISEQTITFSALNQGDQKLIVQHVTPIQAADANIKTYQATFENGAMRVTIAQGECSDNMSDNTYDYKVTVEIKKDNDIDPMVYEGCGSYITDYRLNDIWVLEELEGQKMTSESFSNELPHLEIDTKENRFSGHAGCNRMTGALFFEKELLRFTKVVSTRMMCPPPNKEGEFLKALQASTAYEIANNRLYLSNPDGMKLVFKKVD